MSDQPNVSTDEPIYAAALKVGTVVATALGVVGGAVQLGLVSSDQAETINEIGAQVSSALPELATAITVVVGIVSGIGASVLTAWNARKKVVPIGSDAVTVVPKPAVAAAADPRIPGDGIGDHRLDG